MACRLELNRYNKERAAPFDRAGQLARSCCTILRHLQLGMVHHGVGIHTAVAPQLLCVMRQVDRQGL